MRKFVLVFRKNTPRNPYMFKDLYTDDRVIILDSIMKDNAIENSFLRFLRQVHLSKKVDRFVRLPFKRIWGYTLDDMQWESGVDYYILFIKMWPMEPSYLKKLQKKHKIKYILFLEDPLNIENPREDWTFCEYQRYCMKKMHFDYIFTIDRQDADRYPFIFSDMHYSIISETDFTEPEYDCYFCGYNRGRSDQIMSVYQDMKKNVAKGKIRISGVPENEQNPSEDILYNQIIPYSQVVEEAKRSNCILEILTPSQTGSSLRYYEAVCYNKKLLTNNRNVVNLPFYNPDYMHVFEKPEDIDWNWVKERVSVDYHYDGRFSPTHLVDKIIELEEEKERQANAEKEAH